MMTIRSYSELQKIQTFKERFKYLELTGIVGQTTFGFDRYLNQVLYTSPRWKKSRREVIIRDNGCDLGMEGYEIHSKSRVTVHHMNPITLEDVLNDNPDIYDPEYLISTSSNTHQAIHFGDESLLPEEPVERKQNDTIPWR